MCCGRSRTGNRYNVSSRSITPQSGAVTYSQSGPVFEYTGNSALTVIGPITGVRYRFGRPGSRVHVDSRDSLAMTRVPVLKLIGNSFD
jgi:hypothetical protein